MKPIGDKIKKLRKNKNLTQAQLAESLSVSSQSVSKWENNLSVPDISMLPSIASFFGITIDELFDYRLDVLTHKERFIRFMADNGMLRFGNFELLAGRISPYYIHSGYYHSARQISKFGEFYAECIRINVPDADILVGTSPRQIPIVISSAISLYDKYGLDIDYCVDYSISPEITNERKVVMISDTLTTGETLKTQLNDFYNIYGTYPSDVIIAVDRMEFDDKSPHLSAKNAVELDFGLKIHSIVNFKDILSAINSGVLNETEYIESFNLYRDKYIKV